MKNLLILFLFIGNITVSAQIHKGQNLYHGSHEHAYFLFSNQVEKDLEDDLTEYFQGLGKVSNPEKRVVRLEKLKNNEISNDLEAIDVVFESNKKFQKLSFFFIDKDSDVLSAFQINDRYALELVEGFQKFTLKNLEMKLAKENIKYAEANLADAKKDQSKIEKSLESNLKDQEKLGKKLDATPEMLTKALSEKEEIVGELYSEKEAEVDTKTKEDLEKASTKKEKEILKIQKEKEKAETKLSKKESEFDVLKDNLFKAKASVRSFEAILKDATEVLADLK
ncbi:MAG: hypothetical protein CFE22_13700 [Cytophagaceae bacterium BCCC1]|nr:MAG: hypothetical protein CFE22_13700 [Cytophagaceae bacterium BCCC1]